MKKIASMLLLVAYVAGRAQPTYTWTGKPRFQIVTTQNSATLGVIQVELFPKIAPYHVRNFDSLVSVHFFDTCAFHRVVPGFVIQGGDPNSRHGPVSTWGNGQPGQPTVKAEFSVAQHLRGILSAARLGNNINSATSQFFICVAPASNLNGQYSVYGRVTSGMSVVDAIVNTPTVFATQRPVNKIEMFVTYIGSNDTIPLPPQLTVPANDSVNVDTSYIVLKWNRVQDAQFYHLDVSLDPQFSSTVRSVDVVNLSYPISLMFRDTTYYWKVSANNGGHISTSQVWHFTTLMRSPQLLTPANDTAQVDTAHVVLHWNRSPKAVQHYLHLSYSPLMADTFMYALVNSTSSLSHLLTDTTYYWRVTAKNVKQRSYSDTWHFRSFAKGGYAGFGPVALNASRSVVPNPSHGIFTFLSTRAGEVIQVYDLQGRRVRRLMAAGGVTSVDLSGSQVGIYVYIVTYGNARVSTGKLVVN